MNFNKLDWRTQQDVAEKAIKEFMDNYEIEDTDEDRAGIIELLQDLGVEIDACSSCGAMPMDINCNNARCQDL